MPGLVPSSTSGKPSRAGLKPGRGCGGGGGDDIDPCNPLTWTKFIISFTASDPAGCSGWCATAQGTYDLSSGGYAYPTPTPNCSDCQLRSINYFLYCGIPAFIVRCIGRDSDGNDCGLFWYREFPSGVIPASGVLPLDSSNTCQTVSDLTYAFS